MLVRLVRNTTSSYGTVRHIFLNGARSLVPLLYFHPFDLSQTNFPPCAVIEQVLELVEGYACCQTGRPVNLDAIRRSLSVQLTEPDADNRQAQKQDESVGTEPASRHQPLLGAPFVV